MGLTRQWLETKPAVTDKIKDGPAEFQARWKDVRELLNAAGLTCDSVNPLAEQGRAAVNASGTGINPTIYKSDRTTKILEFLDAGATLLADYPLTGARNVPEASLADDAVGNVISPTTGYKRSMKPLRTFESNPVDTKVNVRPGNYVKTGGLTVGLYAGGNLTIGSAPLALPAAGNHAYYAIVVTGAGTLTAYKGTEVLLASTPVAPNILHGDNLIAIIDIKDTSANFSLLASGANAFLVQDGRIDTLQARVDVRQVAQHTAGVIANELTVLATKAITTTGGLILALAFIDTVSSEAYAFGRAGVSFPVFQGVAVGVSFGVEALAAGTYTYQIRASGAGGGVSASRIWLIELGPTAVV